MNYTFKLVGSLSTIDAQQWDELAGDHPSARHGYLMALEETACASEVSGWAPNHLTMFRGGRLCGAMPMYLKSHSRGEYVFDQMWAQAFHQYGLPYYPKLLCAIPFTPVPGPRLLAQNHDDRVLLASQAIEIARQNGLSSLHILFPRESDQLALREAGFLFRENVQFHWINAGYGSMEDYLSTLNQKNRKKMRQDTRRCSEAGVQFRSMQGNQIDPGTLAFFYRCYEQTYLEHGNMPYLSLAFFQRLLAVLPDSMVIVLALRHDRPIAAALNLRSATHLYGRYWGSVEYVPGLHFETCYVQGIQFCIAHGLSVFEGGAQGEHKLSRGLLPVQTRSAHWIRDRRYAEAIGDFLSRETPAVDAYRQELQQRSPFRKS